MSNIKPQTSRNSTSAKAETHVSKSKGGAIPEVTRITDAAVLAEIDTSGYSMPGVKVPGRRGRRPAEFQPEDEEITVLNAIERAELKAVRTKQRNAAAGTTPAVQQADQAQLEARHRQIAEMMRMAP